MDARFVVDSSSVVCVTDACDVSYLAFNQIQYFFLSEASFDVICVTEQHYVSIFFTRLWSVQTALILDTQNAEMKTALILDTQNAEMKTALILDTQNAEMKTALILDTQNAEILGF